MKIGNVLLIVTLLASLVVNTLMFISNTALNKKVDSLSGSLDQQVEITKGLVQASNQQVTQEQLSDFMDSIIQNNKELEKVIKAKKEQPVTIVHNITTTGPANEVVLQNIPSDYVYETSSGLVVAEHHITDNKFTAKTHELTIDQSIVLTKDTNDNIHAYSDSSIRSSGGGDKAIPLDTKLSEVKFTKQPKQMLFAPHIAVGPGIGFNPVEKQVNFNLNGQLTFFAYGETKSDNDLRILGINAGLGIKPNETKPLVNVGIIPVEFNIGKPLPLLDDLYLYPDIGITINTNGQLPNFNIGLGINSTL